VSPKLSRTSSAFHPRAASQERCLQSHLKSTALQTHLLLLSAHHEPPRAGGNQDHGTQPLPACCPPSTDVETPQGRLFQANLLFHGSSSWCCCKNLPNLPGRYVLAPSWPLRCHPALTPCHPSHLLRFLPPLSQKGREDPPRSKLCLKNEKMSTPQHPPREQSRASRGPCTCENVRNPNVWTGFLCLPQTSKHDRHPNGAASRAAVSSGVPAPTAGLCQLVPPGGISSAQELTPCPVFRSSAASRFPPETDTRPTGL